LWKRGCLWELVQDGGSLSIMFVLRYLCDILFLLNMKILFYHDALISKLESFFRRR
jgi:hypothetical protein